MPAPGGHGVHPTYLHRRAGLSGAPVLRSLQEEQCQCGSRLYEQVALTGTTESPQQFAGAQLLLADARTAFMLANYARKRAIVSAFGVSPKDANAVTVGGLALIAAALHQTIGPRLKRTVPTPSDAVLGAGVARSLLGAVVGPTVDEMPGLGALIALALVVHGARPTAIRSAEALRANSRRLALELRHFSDYVLGR